MSHHKVEITARAARQLAQARAWWTKNREKAPRAFDEDIDVLLGQLEERPALLGSRVAEEPTVRRVHLRRIRYHVYFRILGRERVQVLALWHTSRGGVPSLE